jgi:hypothetical protein
MKPNLKRKQSVPNLNRARSDNWTRLPCRPQFRSSHGSTKLRPSRRFPPDLRGRTTNPEKALIGVGGAFPVAVRPKFSPEARVTATKH